MKPFLERAYGTDVSTFENTILEGARYYDAFLNKLLAETPKEDYPLLALCFEHAALLIREVYQAGPLIDLLKLKLGTQAVQYPNFDKQEL